MTNAGVDRELVQKWVAALRSGEYKQGYGRLHLAKDNSFCCLGVLCEVAGVKKVPPPTRGGWGNYYLTGSDGRMDSHVISPSSELYSRAGLGAKTSGFSSLGSELVNRNDARESFEEIANFIEDTLLKA